MMKTLKYSLLLCFACCFFNTAHAHSPTLKVDKTISKSFPISSNGTLSVDNSYGEIKVINWQKDEIKFEILITAEASSNSKAQKSIDNITVDFSKKGDHVKAATEFDSSGGSWWSWGSKNVKYKVNYVIHAPTSLNIELEMSYGDIILEARSGGFTKIDLAYGDVTGTDLDKRLDLELSYGNAVFHSIHDAKLEIVYGDFNCVAAGDLHISSAYSDFKIQKAGNVRIKGDYDDYILGDIGDLLIKGDYNDIDAESIGGLTVKSDYTDVKAHYLNGPIDIKADYGSYIINGMGPKTTSGSFKCEYLTIKLISDLSFGVHVESQYTSVKMGNDWEVTNKVKDGSDLEILAHRGSKSPLFTFNTDYCTIILK